MSDQRNSAERATERTAMTKPAIGIVAGPDVIDAVYRTILESQARDFPVYLVPTADLPDTALDIAKRLGVTIVDSPGTGADRETLESALATAVRRDDRPGVVFQPEGCPLIDYDRTLEAFESGGFQIDAVPEPSHAPSKGPHILAGIPAYNAAESISDVVREALAVADSVLVVDDGSSDETAVRAREAGASVIIHPRNRGYGGALKTLFRAAKRIGADHLVTIDADGQHNPADIPRLVAAQDETGAGVVIGSRYVDGSETDVPFVRSIGLGVVNLLTNVSMGRFQKYRRLTDTQSGLRAYTADAVSTVVDAADVGDGMWASTDILYVTNDAGFHFHEVGTTIRYDVASGSTEGAASHGLGLVHNIAGFFQRTRPVLLAGLPGLILLLIGVVLLMWSLERQISGAPSYAPTVTATLTIAAGGVLLVLSVFLHVLNTHPFFNEEWWTRQQGGRE